MTKDRIYAIINGENMIGSLSFYDENGKRKIQIDIDKHEHIVDGISLGMRHAHIGYFHDENGNRVLTKEEEALVQRVLKIWKENKNVR